MPHAEYEVYGPHSKATTSRSGSRRFAVLAALIPAASPPTIASRRPIVAQTLLAAGHSSRAPPPARAVGIDSVPIALDAPKFGKVPGYGRRRLTSLADTPWMTEAVRPLPRGLRPHHAPTRAPPHP